MVINDLQTLSFLVTSPKVSQQKRQDVKYAAGNANALSGDFSGGEEGMKNNECYNNWFTSVKIIPGFFFFFFFLLSRTLKCLKAGYSNFTPVFQKIRKGHTLMLHSACFVEYISKGFNY